MNDLSFYERVKSLTKSQNKNLREVIESCGINYDSYNSCKRYGNLPRANEVVAMAKALNTTAEYLVTGEQTYDKTAIIKHCLKELIDQL